ncbi:hypothetical protein Ancab_022964 [Ancistrocladus abbreviatus]
MEANRRSYADVVSNGKPEGVGLKTPLVFQTHQDLGTPLVCAVSTQEVTGKRFVVRVNEETFGESLYFPREDCRPVWHSNYAGCHGLSSSAKGAGESGEASESRQVNISNPSKILAIGISIGREGACGNITTEKCTREARRNDDTIVHSLRLDVNRGGRSRESEGLVERGTGSILPRELVGSLVGLGHGPACYLSDEDDGPSLAPGLSFKCSEQGGLEIIDRGFLSLSQSREVGILCSRPERNRLSDDCVKSFAGLPTSSGLRVSRRLKSGLATTERACHLKSRPKKVGCVLSTVKLGVGAR